MINMILNNPIKIPVKKTDGSLVYLTLAEIKALKERKMSNVKLPSANIKPHQIKEIKRNLDQTLSQHDKLKPTMEQLSSGVIKHRDFASSPLEEKLDSRHTHLPNVTPNRANEVDEIIKKININIPQDNVNRFRSILQLHLKDIRDDHQTEEVLLRPILDGGMGFSFEQTKKVLAVIDEKEQHELLKKTEVLPSVYREPPVPAISTPNAGFFEHSEATKQDKETVRHNDNEPLKLESDKPARRTVMHDIVSPAGTVEFGPLEELANFTWHDFRNLSAKPTDAANRLKQKLMLLKDESFVLYMQGLQAFKTSPLFNDYIQLVDAALKNRQSLPEVLDKNGKIKMEEIKALVEMEGGL